MGLLGWSPETLGSGLMGQEQLRSVLGTEQLRVEYMSWGVEKRRKQPCGSWVLSERPQVLITMNEPSLDTASLISKASMMKIPKILLQERLAYEKVRIRLNQSVLAAVRGC